MVPKGSLVLEPVVFLHDVARPFPTRLFFFIKGLLDGIVEIDRSKVSGASLVIVNCCVTRSTRWSREFRCGRLFSGGGGAVLCGEYDGVSDEQRGSDAFIVLLDNPLFGGRSRPAASYNPGVQQHHFFPHGERRSSP